MRFFNEVERKKTTNKQISIQKQGREQEKLYFLLFSSESIEKVP